MQIRLQMTFMEAELHLSPHETSQPGNLRGYWFGVAATHEDHARHLVVQDVIKHHLVPVSHPFLVSSSLPARPRQDRQRRLEEEKVSSYCSTNAIASSITERYSSSPAPTDSDIVITTVFLNGKLCAQWTDIVMMPSHRQGWSLFRPLGAHRPDHYSRAPVSIPG